MPASPAAAVRTVIVADDTAFVRDRFKAAVEGAGHRALTVCTAADLLLRLRLDRDHVDLVLLDLRLPDANGVDVVRGIRAIDGGAVPILVFSGTIESADEVRTLASLGVAGYINEYSAVQHILPGLSPHLFPDAANKRESPRVVVGVPSAYRFGNTIVAALTLNLSHGGMAIRTTSPLDAGTHVRVRFRLPGTERDIDADACVAWSNPRLGMGLQFRTVSPEDQQSIDDFVDRHFFTHRKA